MQYGVDCSGLDLPNIDGADLPSYDLDDDAHEFVTFMAAKLKVEEQNRLRTEEQSA